MMNELDRISDSGPAASIKRAEERIARHKLRAQDQGPARAIPIEQSLRDDDDG